MTADIQTPIAVLGAGSWGTALALYLARRGQEVRLWTNNIDHFEEMNRDKTNKRYMPGHVFPETLRPMASLISAIENCHDILIAIPSAGFRNILMAIKPLLKHSVNFLCAAKGLDLDTGKLLHLLAYEVLGPDHCYGVISGPSFASEVAEGLPTAVVIASENIDYTYHFINRFNSPIFRVYSSTDITGVEIGGVVKNVLAIACGISDGMGFGANARSGLITRGLHEMTLLGLALGANAETFTGLTGVGDLVLTCTDDQSRNRRFGLALGKGKSPTDAAREIGQVIEGKRNAELVVQLARDHQVEMPITEMILQILQEKLTPLEAMKQLLARETKKEGI